VKLGGNPDVTVPRQGPPTSREIYELIRQESRIADKRTDGMNALIEVARVEAEESRERRRVVSGAPLSPEDMDLARRMVDTVNRRLPDTGADQQPPPGPRAPHGQ
jgi:hypothetical protein